MQMSQAEFQQYKKDCDGFCSMCKSIVFNAAEPLAENRYCPECENRAVLGMEKARSIGLIEVVR
jgi:hypothetical protein